MYRRTLTYKRSWALRTIALAVFAALPGAAVAQERPTAFTGATIIPIAGEPIENGTLVVQGGKIVAVGPADSVRVPNGGERVDFKGKTIMPGLGD